MMTFGDCMSLLVCFFVMLIAFSNMESAKLSTMLGAMRGALGGVAPIESILPEDSLVEADGLSRIEAETETQRFLTLEEMADLVPQMIAEIRASNQSDPDGWPDRILIRMLDDGLTIILETDSLFIDGTAEWADPVKNRLWSGLASLLAGRGNEILITAILAPLTTVNSETSRSVWGLGVERAEVVANAIQAAMKTDARRFGTGVQLATGNGGLRTDTVLITVLGMDDAVELRENGSWPTGVWQ
jgi:chemotaxis protein MotB